VVCGSPAARQGGPWWEFAAGIAQAQEERQHIDPWEDTLRGYMAHGRPTGLDEQGRCRGPDGWIASAVIMREWLRLEPHQQGQASSTRLGKIMRHLNYVPKRSATGGERGWIPETRHPPDAQGVS
jgi:hypothetical protein